MFSIYFVTLFLPGLSSLPLSQVAEASDDFPAVHCCPGRYLGTLTAQLCLTKLSNDYNLTISCAFTVQSTLACSYSGRPCSFLWQMSRTAMMIIFLDSPGWAFVHDRGKPWKSRLYGTLAIRFGLNCRPKKAMAPHQPQTKMKSKYTVKRPQTKYTVKRPQTVWGEGSQWRRHKEQWLRAARTCHKKQHFVCWPGPQTRTSTRVSQDRQRRTFCRASCKIFIQFPPTKNTTRKSSQAPPIEVIFKIFKNFVQGPLEACHQDLDKIFPQGPLKKKWPRFLYSTWTLQYLHARSAAKIPPRSPKDVLTRTSARSWSRASYEDII